MCVDTAHGNAPVTVGASNAVPVGKGDAVVCTFTNTRDTGQIKVVKDFQGAPGTARANLQVDGVTKLANAADGGDTGFVTVDSGAHAVGETAGTGTSLLDYTSSIACVNAAGAPAGSGSGTSLTGITVAKDAQITCTITNIRDTGSLTIQKALSNPDNASVPAGFTISYTCTLDGAPNLSGTVSVPGNGEVTVPNIPTRYSCTIEEATLSPINNFTWAGVTYDPKTQTIAAKGVSYIVKAVNSITRDKGSLELIKTLTGAPEGWTVPAFDITYRCTIGESVTKSGTAQVTPGAPVVIDGVPTGSSCVITETTFPKAPEGYSFEAPTFTPEDATVIVAERGQTVSVTTKNSLKRDVGSILISKRLFDGGSGFTGPFTIEVTCTLEGSPIIKGSLFISASGSETVNNIPTGYVCTVAEPNLPAVSGFRWSAPSFVGAPTAPIAKGQTASILVINALSPFNEPPTNPPTTPTPVTPEVVPPTVVEPGVVESPTPTPTPEVITPPVQPGTVPIPEEAVIPSGVPAGGGAPWNAPAWILAMLVIGTGITFAAGFRLRTRTR